MSTIFKNAVASQLTAAQQSNEQIAVDTFASNNETTEILCKCLFNAAQI